MPLSGERFSDEAALIMSENLSHYVYLPDVQASAFRIDIKLQMKDSVPCLMYSNSRNSGLPALMGEPMCFRSSA